jgi:hypothetical protein
MRMIFGTVNGELQILAPLRLFRWNFRKFSISYKTDAVVKQI